MSESKFDTTMKHLQNQFDGPITQEGYIKFIALLALLYLLFWVASR